MFNISNTSNKPIYEQIIENIKELSLKKVLKPNDKLPSVRQMANILGVNPNTVSKAYQELERQKITSTIVGKGTFINSDTKLLIDKERMERAIENLKSICIELGHLGFEEKRIIDEIKKIYKEIDKEA